MARLYAAYRDACDALVAQGTLTALRVLDDRGWPERGPREILEWTRSQVA